MMKRISAAMAAAAITITTVAAGCGGGTDQPEGGDTAPTASAPAASGSSADANITFTSTPEPPVTGENTFEVMVLDQNGQPVTDANVSVEFYMAAMPEVKMPEMRNRIELTHQGGGRYGGTGNVMMGGEWDVTVAATRNGEEIGRRTFDVTAK